MVKNKDNCLVYHVIIPLGIFNRYQLKPFAYTGLKPIVRTPNFSLIHFLKALEIDLIYTLKYTFTYHSGVFPRYHYYSPYIPPTKH
jgi:hypothetical protein